MRSSTAPSPHTPPHPAHMPHTPHTPSYNEKLEEALLQPTSSHLMRRIPIPSRRMSSSTDNSDVKRPRHDNNNTEQPQIHAADFSTKNHSLVNNTRAHESGNNGNGISNSSSSPSPRLMDEVKNEPLDMICQSNPDIDRSTDDTPPHSHLRPLVSIL